MKARIFFTSRNIGISLSLLFLISALLTWIISRSEQPVNTQSYRVRENFPPLIFLPDYQQGLPIYASSSILIEAGSGAILFAKDPEARRAPASTTKMMTAIVAIERGKLDQVIQVSPRAAGTPGSSLWLRAGDRITLWELLKGMMLHSGNDGSMAVAEGVAGSVERFVDWMNIKAKEIGALKTSFRNPHGLRAPSHYTTAMDLALIARYGLTNKYFAELVRQKTGTLRFADRGMEMPLSNTNRLLWYLEGADGVKTGTTNEAGHCLVSSATRDGKQLIAVVLNSGDRWDDSARLLEYGFRGFSIIKAARHDRPVCRIQVQNASRSWIYLYPRRDLAVVVRKGQEPLVSIKTVVFNNPIEAPLRVGRILGKIQYRYRNRLVEEVDLVNYQPVTVKKRVWFNIFGITAI